VFEAAKKLNEVKSIKGLDRYFKQIAQSARTDHADKNAHVDDFLGSVDIRLDDIPSNGIEKWYELEGKSERSKVTGSIRLRIKLATREDSCGSILHASAEEDNWNDFKQQIKLMSIFIDHELAKHEDSVNWNGQFCREAETILHQHAIQGDVTDFQLAIW
jgi:BAI1-associated protein 3